MRSSTKINEFENVKLPKNVFEENFLRLTVTECLQQKEYFKNVNFFFSEQVIITWLKQNKFTFHPHF